MRGYQNIYLETRSILEAMARFARTHPRARLYFDGSSGHPGERAHERWIRRLGVNDAVSQLHLTRPQVLRAMQHCDLYVSASASDGLPISLLEALYFGMVPVVTRHESYVPPLEEDGNAVTVGSHDPAEIAEAWDRALRLAGDRHSRIRANRARLEDGFMRDANLERVVTLYGRLAAGLHGPSAGVDHSTP